LSAVLQIGDTLWVANDESVSLERLSRIKKNTTDNCRYQHHKKFSLDDYLRLPATPPDDPAELEEIDVEGLDYEDGYLWVVGSHSLKRKKPS